MKSNVLLVRPPDGNLNGLLSDFRWGQESGKTVELKFSFTAPGSEFVTGDYDDSEGPDPTIDVQFRAHTDKEKDIVRAIITELETFADIKLSEVTDSVNSDIRFGISNVGEGSAAFAYAPDAKYVITGADPLASHESRTNSGDVWAGVASAEPESTEAYFRSTVIHELGHALGLCHPHDTGYFIDRDQAVSDALILKGGDLDQYRYTVMSYNSVAAADKENQTSVDKENASYTQLDIQTLQSLHGTSKDTGNDLYIIGSANSTDSVTARFSSDRQHQHDNLYVGIGDSDGSNTLFINFQGQNTTINLQAGARC